MLNHSFKNEILISAIISIHEKYCYSRENISIRKTVGSWFEIMGTSNSHCFRNVQCPKYHAFKFDW